MSSNVLSSALIALSRNKPLRRDLQRSLVQDGDNVRVYIPFGSEWYPYFMRRLAERSANPLFIAKNLLK